MDDHRALFPLNNNATCIVVGKQQHLLTSEMHVCNVLVSESSFLEEWSSRLLCTIDKGILCCLWMFMLLPDLTKPDNRKQQANMWISVAFWNQLSISENCLPLLQNGMLTR